MEFRGFPYVTLHFTISTVLDKNSMDSWILTINFISIWKMRCICFTFYIFETLDTVSKIFPSRFMKCFCFRFQTTFSSTSSKIIIDKFVVNDYHACKIRPFTSTPPVYLLIENIQRCLCMFGIDYPLKKFPLHVHNNITDEKRQLKVIDIAGLPIRYVP